MQATRNGMVALLPRLRAFARSLARNPDAADDLVQATCERALRSIGGFQAGTRLDSWMFRIMRNLWIDTYRKTANAAPADMQIGDAAGEDGRRTTEANLMLASVRAAIDRLPEEQRSVLMLVCVEELSYREAADILDIPMGTVMSRLARARAALVTTMEDASARDDPDSAKIGGRRQ